MSHSCPVLIVGAGPTGLTMAVTLQRHGIPFRIIDKAIKPVTTSNAIIVHTRTLEVWDDLGLFSQALEKGNIIHEFSVYAKKEKLVSVNFDDIESTHRFILGLSQHCTEEILHAALQAQQISIEMETELIDLIEQSDSVTATLRHADGTTETVTTDWLIACDGGHSFIREKLQLEFRGKDLTEHFILADLPLASNLAKENLALFLTEQGPLIIAYYNQENARIIAEVTHDPVLHDAKSVTQAQTEKILADRCPFPLQPQPAIWTSGFWIHERLIAAYQKNRVFFMGDTAHIHSPAGGQGMNTGIQDAYNLAWKLALVIQKHATSKLLSSYAEERQAVAKTLLKNTTALTYLMTLRHPILVALRNFMLPMVAHSEKLRKKIAMKITQLAIHYKKSSLTHDCLKQPSRSQAGMRMVDVEREHDRLFDYVRGPRFCLLAFSGITDTDLAPLKQLVQTIEEKYPNLIKVLLIQANSATWEKELLHDQNQLIHQAYQTTQPQLYLIRPDKYIGFRGEWSHGEALLGYLERVFDQRKD